MATGTSSFNAVAAQEPDDLKARERILREATRLFARHGYEGTSLRMIAESVGMQKGSLVYHFESKEKIRESALDGLIARWRDVVPQILLVANSGENRFERTMAECTGFFLDDPNRARLLLREALDYPDELRERIIRQIAPWLELIADRIRQGQDEGRIYKSLDPLAYIWEVVLLTLTTIAVSGTVGGLLGARAGASGTGAGTVSSSDRMARELTRIARTSLFRTPPSAVE
jgi:TetR/AcrR family transcriptional regulator